MSATTTATTRTQRPTVCHRTNTSHRTPPVAMGKPTHFPQGSRSAAARYNFKWLLSFVSGGSLYRRQIFVALKRSEHNALKDWFEDNHPWFEFRKPGSENFLRKSPDSIKPKHSHLSHLLIQRLFVLKFNSPQLQKQYLPSILRAILILTELQLTPAGRVQDGMGLFPGLTNIDLAASESISQLLTHLCTASQLEREHLLDQLDQHPTIPTPTEVDQWIASSISDLAKKLSTTEAEVKRLAAFDLTIPQAQCFKGLSSFQITLGKATNLTPQALDFFEHSYRKAYDHLKIWIVAILLDPIIDGALALAGPAVISLDITRLLIVKIALGTLALDAAEWIASLLYTRQQRGESLNPTFFLPLLYTKAIRSLQGGTALGSFKKGLNFGVKGPGLSAAVDFCVGRSVPPLSRSILTRCAKRLSCSHYTLPKIKLADIQLRQTLNQLLVFSIMIGFEGVLMYHVKAETKTAMLTVEKQYPFLNARREAYFMSVIFRDILGYFIDDTKYVYTLLRLLMVYAMLAGSSASNS